MYHMTVYDHTGKTLYDESISATFDQKAKEIGYQWLTDNQVEENPHRIFHTTGRLISFNPHQLKPKEKEK